MQGSNWGSNWEQCREAGGPAGGPAVPTTEQQEGMGAAPSSIMKGWLSQCMLVVFQKHRGLQANRGVLETWRAGMCTQSCKPLYWLSSFAEVLGCTGVSVFHAKAHIPLASTFACCAPSLLLPGVPDHRYLLIYLQLFHLQYLFHTHMHVHPASPLRSGLILHMLYSQMGFWLPTFTCIVNGTV